MIRLLATLLLAGGTAYAQVPEPTGVWKLDPAVVARVSEAVADAMARSVGPEERRAILTQAKDLEAEYARLLRQDPAAAQALEPELREARAAAQAMHAPQGFFREQFLRSLGDVDASFELQDDGTLLARSSLGEAEPGAWSVEGDRIELLTVLPGAPGGATVLHLEGPVGAERMELKEVRTPEDDQLLASTPELAQAMRDAVWVLVRQPEP